MALELELVAATADDLAAVRGLLDGVRAWLGERGSTQWARPFTEEWVRERIADGEFWIATRDGELVGVVRLLWADPVFWGDLEDGSAVYVHTLATRRDLAGQGIGAAMLARIDQLAQARGRSVVRLDCGAANARLCSYYEALEFRRMGERVVGGETMALYERAIGSAAEDRVHEPGRPHRLGT